MTQVPKRGKDNWVQETFVDRPHPSPVLYCACGGAGTWVRLKGPVPAHSFDISLICLRGRFEVKDLAAAGDISFRRT